MSGIGSWEIIAVLVIVLLIFGPKNLPRLAKSLGSSVRELKRGVQGLSEDLDESVNKPNNNQEKPAARESEKQSDAQPVEKKEDTHSE